MWMPTPLSLQATQINITKMEEAQSEVSRPTLVRLDVQSTRFCKT
jgi:hypothetical protein